MVPPLSKTHNLAWRKFLSVHATLIEKIEQDLSAANLPPLSWYDLLFVLSEAPEQKMRLSNLAQAVLLSRSNITRLVHRLEKAGLIRREPCQQDRRGTFAAITRDGCVILAQMWSIYEAGIVEYFAYHLDETEAKQLAKILTRMLKD